MAPATLGQLLTFQLAGSIPRAIEFDSVEEAVAWGTTPSDTPFVILGRGSNTLINPDATPTVVRLSPTASPITRSGNRVVFPAGLPTKKMIDASIEMGLSGLEFAAGVPASLGGMVAMNFGCWGQCMADLITRIQVIDRHKVTWWPVTEAQFDYRSSVFQSGIMVLAAELQLVESDPIQMKAASQQAIQRRLATQPLRQKTFGSIFRNPPGHHAAHLLESAGLKGQRWGDIELSAQHANFLVNHGQATYQDTLAVITHLIDTVVQCHGVVLQPEVRMMG